MSALYTIGVYQHRDGQSTVREIVNPEWRMTFVQADSLAAEYTGRYARAGRTYAAVNVRDIETWAAPNERSTE